MRTPSIKTLAQVFENPKEARRIMEMSRDGLMELDPGYERANECLNPPATWDIRMHVLNAIESGLHGLKSIESTGGEFASYLNAGDTYTPTLIYWRNMYRVQSVGDFIEAMERQSVRFN